jgi:putative PIN family toxin of toxin-antitoxin system
MVVKRTKNRKILIDTDLWISLLLGNKVTELQTLFNHKYLIMYTCQELIDEFIKVASSSRISKHITKRNIAEVLELMEVSCIKGSIDLTATARKIFATRTRVVYYSDLYLIPLSDTENIDYIVTGDKDLLRQLRHIDTKLMSFTTFMERVKIFTDKDPNDSVPLDIESLKGTMRKRGL